jgi:hypothetical protein
MIGIIKATQRFATAPLDQAGFKREDLCVAHEEDPFEW